MERRVWEPHRPAVRTWVMPPEPQLCHARNSGVFREPQEFLFITCTQAHHNRITPPTSTPAPLHVPKATGTFLLHRPAPLLLAAPSNHHPLQCLFSQEVFDDYPYSGHSSLHLFLIAPLSHRFLKLS